MPPIAGLAKLLRNLNRSLRVGGITKSTRGKAAAKLAKRKRKLKNDQLSVRVDKLPEIKAALAKAGPGATIVATRLSTGEVSTRKVFDLLTKETKKPIHGFLRETPSSAKGRYRKETLAPHQERVREWEAEQAAASAVHDTKQLGLAKAHATKVKRRLRRKKGRTPTKKELEYALRVDKFVPVKATPTRARPQLSPFPRDANIIASRRAVKEVIEPGIALAPLKFKNTKDAKAALGALPDDDKLLVWNKLNKAAKDDMASGGKSFSRKTLDDVGKAVDEVTYTKPSPTISHVQDVKARVARQEARTGVLGEKIISPAVYGTRDVKKIVSPAIEVDIKDAAGNITTERVSLGAVAKSDPSFARHRTRVGKRIRKTREEKMLGPGNRVADDIGIEGDIASAMQDVDLQDAGGWISRNKLLTGALATDAVIIGAPMATGLYGSTIQDYTGENPVDETQSHSYMMRQHRTMVNQEAHHQQQIMQLQKLMAQNMGRLATVAPHIYNQVLAGQQIPQGGVVIGGQPRTDLMEQLAYDMSTGGYQNQQGQQDLLQSFAQM